MGWFFAGGKNSLKQIFPEVPTLQLPGELFRKLVLLIIALPTQFVGGAEFFLNRINIANANATSHAKKNVFAALLADGGEGGK